MELINRNGARVAFDVTRIEYAVVKAMKHVGYMNYKAAEVVSHKVMAALEQQGAVEVTTKQVEDLVFAILIEEGLAHVAKEYERFRGVQEYKRQTNTIDSALESLLVGSNDELNRENANKNTKLLPTQRDYMAGIVSKDLARRKAIPAHLLAAHDSGAVYLHDMDWFANAATNCELTNLQDMLDNGTVINKRKISSPKTFQVAATLTSQIIAQVSAHSYGLSA